MAVHNHFIGNHRGGGSTASTTSKSSYFTTDPPHYTLVAPSFATRLRKSLALDIFVGAIPKCRWTKMTLIITKTSTIQFVSRSNVSFSFVVKIISFIRILVSPLLERAILKEALIKRQDIVFT